MLVFSIQLSLNGWTDHGACKKWFETVFVPYALARHVCPDKPIVLTLDVHNLHETQAMKRIAHEHNIVIFCFPSKTIHKLQPLDVVVFSAVQHGWSDHCDEQLARGITIDRYNVVHEYVAMQNSIVMPALIQKSFEKTGIYPFNPGILTDADYAPSMASSTTTHVPPSFPPEVPSSPPAIFSDKELEDDDEDYQPGASGMDDKGIDLDGEA